MSSRFAVWRGPRSRIYEAWYDGRWHDPVNRGWRSASAPSVAVADAEHMFMYWLAGAHVWEGSYAGSWIGPVRRWRVDPGTEPYVEAVQTTADRSDLMRTESNLQFGASVPGHLPVIKVNDGIRYQQVTGVGAAVTDSSAWLIQDELNPTARTVLMQDLFRAIGIHLSFILAPMGASDFTQQGRPYTYDDVPAGQTDPQLKHFSIAHDQAYVIPVLRQMLAINPHTGIFAVPWSPPAWMKANSKLDDLGDTGSLLPFAYQPLAGYFVKFIQAYASEGVPISAIAPENEPEAESAFPAMYFPEPNEALWISQDLTPALAAANLKPKVYGFDSGWATPAYRQALIASGAANTLAGIAWHCYGGIPTAMSILQSLAPTLDQLVTECAPNLTTIPVPEIVIGAMRNWANAVTLWNLALDPSGGPVQLPNSACNGCTGLVTINETTHNVSFSLSYYQLGQIGSFVEPGAWRISSNSYVTYYQQSHTNYGATAGLDDVAFVNPDGSRVLVAYNNSSARIRFAVEWNRRAFTYTPAPTATVSFEWNPNP